MIGLLLALTVMPVAEVDLSASDRLRAAAGIRAYGYACPRLTRVERVGPDRYRVACGRHVYRVRWGSGATSIEPW